MPSVDIITTGRPDLTEYAADYGYLRGTRLDDEPRYRREGVRVDFLDVHWEDPDFNALLEAAEWHRPRYAVAGDYDGSNYETVNDRARRLREHAENVIVVPHEDGDLEHAPEWTVVGYSTPSEYAGTEIPLREYRQTSHDIHILGGTPHEQHRLLGRLWVDNVVSMDCNSHHKAATIGAKAWHAPRPHWRKVGPGKMDGAVEQAYKLSVVNLNQEHQRRGLFPATDGGETPERQDTDRNRSGTLTMTDVNTNPDPETIAAHTDHEDFRATRIGVGEQVDIHFYCPACDVRLIVQDIPRDDITTSDRFD